MVRSALVAVCGLGICTSASGGKYLLDEVKPIWAKLDINRDGYISRSEIVDEDPKLVAGFEQADFDKDGYLGLRELEFLLISS
jgi:Ca2+-binding EF-hand superfamily protein